MDRRLFLSSLVTLGALPWAGLARADKDELAVIVHPDTPVKVLGESELSTIFLTTRIEWSEGTRIVPFNLPPKSPGRTDFDQAVLHMNADEAARYWIDRRIRGGNRPPRQVPAPQLMTAVVGRLKGAIGYVPRPLADSSVKLVAIIRNGKVVAP